MKVITKRLKVIQMTQSEMRDFLALIEKARDGTTVNYAEQKLQDGSFLGVSIEPGEPEEPVVDYAKPKRAY
jgi:hypothetical protein